MTLILVEAQLIVVEADKVGDQPRVWVTDEEAGRRSIASPRSLRLHTTPRAVSSLPMATHAIVEATATLGSKPDPREVEFWSATFRTGLTAMIHQLPSTASDSVVAAACAALADTCTAEWHKRFGDTK